MNTHVDEPYMSYDSTHPTLLCKRIKICTMNTVHYVPFERPADQILSHIAEIATN